MSKKLRLNLSFFLVLVLLYASIISLTSLTSVAQNQPVGLEGITYNNTENASIRPAISITTAGGTITTMNLNATSQNPHWKGFVGNITGNLALQDSAGYVLYEWTLASVSGEVYVTRNSTINWTDIDCANASEISTEEGELSHNASQSDSISSTFGGGQGNHPAFTTASTDFSVNQCNYTLNTYVNSTINTSRFYEAILHDGFVSVYASIIENRSRGFDDSYYDFQLIVPENGTAAVGSSTTYYFFIELL